MESLYNNYINSYYPFSKYTHSWMIASLVFKEYSHKYSFKSFQKKVWINKIDSTLSINIVEEEFIQDIKKISYILIDYNTIYNNTEINNIINKLENEIFIQSVLKESKELFYNN